MSPCVARRPPRGGHLCGRLTEFYSAHTAAAFATRYDYYGLTCGYAGTGPSNLFEVLQAAGVSETLVARSDITQRGTKTIPLHLEREVKQYGDFQYA